jgi:sterol desaturase/sphingolipid hydroxylase (fatty acid hydroxylase superfamily)
MREPLIRLGAFVVVFGVVALWEAFAPCRVQAISGWKPWPNNVGIVVVNTVALRVLFAAPAVGMSFFATDRGWGLRNVLNVPTRIAVPILLVLLDFAIYAPHVGFHAIAPLWRLHRVHHADLEFDVTTGLRFHPAEIILSMLIDQAGSNRRPRRACRRDANS